jgi:hypothetical protein
MTAMKIYSCLLALCFFHANVCGTTAFSVVKATRAAVVLRSSTSDDELPSSTSDDELPPVAASTFLPDEGAVDGAVGPVQDLSKASSDLPVERSLMTPIYPKMERIEGGGRVHTYPVS